MGRVTSMELRRIDELHPYERNAKLHPPEQIQKLRKSFREFGMIVPVGIDAQDRVVYGHGRLLAAQEEGWTEIPTVTITDLTDEQRRAFVHADNLLSETGYDKEILRSEAEALQAAGFDITLVGFDAAGIKLETIEAQLEEIQEADEINAEDLPARVQRGQRWQLGDHILMCGDSSNLEELQQLVASTPPHFVFTDPPYGVSIGDRNAAINAVAPGKGGRIEANIANDTLPPDQLYEILVKAFSNLRQVCAEDCSYYVSSPQGGELGLMMMMMRDAGLTVRHMLIWVKNVATFSMGRLDYDYRHEPIFYTWTKKHNWFGDYANSVIDDSLPIDKMSKAELKEFIRAKLYPQEQSTIYCDKPNASKLHPTMKPVKLVARFILNSSQRGDVAADIFGGSGTTLIACEQLGRKCRMMELDPHYCDVIIARWEAFTGKKAELLHE